MKRTMYLLLTIVLGITLAGCSASKRSEDSAMSAPSGQPAADSYESQPMPSSPNDMYFQDYGTNPFVSAEEDAFSTFAIDVDTGSYTVARSYIEDGHLPPQEAVRLEEFVNYFDLDDEPPKDDTFAIHVDAGDSPFRDEEYKLVRIGIRGKEMDAEERQQAHLTFVIDVSGSMKEDNRIGLVKRSLKLLLKQLNKDDKVGIVVYGSEARSVLEPTPVSERDTIEEAIDSLRIEGATNAEDGLLLGYQMASGSFDEKAMNRIILCSDGVANIGETDAGGILKKIEDYAAQGIYLNTFGYGMGNYNDVLMEQLADRGDGTYAYIDDMDEAKKVFKEQLSATLQTIAKDAKIQVEFDPEMVDSYRLLGYENRAIRDDDFRNNYVDGGEVGAGHSVTALYKVKLKRESDKAFGIVTLRYKDVGNDEEIRETNAPIRLSAELSRSTRFAAAVARFAETIGDSERYPEKDLEEVLQVAKKNAASERQETFVDLVERAMELGVNS